MLNRSPEIQQIRFTHLDGVLAVLVTNELGLKIGRKICGRLSARILIDLPCHVSHNAEQNGCRSKSLLSVEKPYDSLCRLRERDNRTKEMWICAFGSTYYSLFVNIVPKRLDVLFLPHVSALESGNHNALA